MRAASWVKEMNKGTPENRALFVQKKRNRTGIGHGSEHTRRSLGSPKGTRQYISENLGQRTEAPVSWGNHGNRTRNLAGSGWGDNNQFAQVRAESGQLKRNNVISYHACTAFEIPRSISETRPAPTEVQVMTLIVGKLYGAVHDNNYVRARLMDNDDVIGGFPGNRISVWGPEEEIKDLHECFTSTQSTHASGPRVDCHMEDWPSSTPTPVLERHSKRHFSNHATKEVLIIGYGANVCTQFRRAYLTLGIRDDCFKTGGYAKNVQEACFPILDTLREVLTNAGITISLLELMRVGPKFMVVDMVTSVFYGNLKQNERSAKLDAWIRAACNASPEHTESDFTVNKKVYPDKETPLPGCDQSGMAQYDMEINALFELRTTREDGFRLAASKSGEVIATMVAIEIMQQLAGKLYEFTINTCKKIQCHEPSQQRSRSVHSNQIRTVIYDVVKAAAQQLTDGEHISVNDVNLNKQREEFKEATSLYDLGGLANVSDIKAYAYDATMLMLQNHGSRDIYLGGLHYIISHLARCRYAIEGTQRARWAGSLAHSP